MSDKECLTMPAELAAKLAGIGRSLAYEMCRAGTFPGCIKLNNRYVISKRIFFSVFNGDSNGTQPQESEL